jgi:hypothetical protein
LAIVLCFLTGCSGTSTAPGVACPAIAVELFVIYPKSGATNVVDAQNVVVVAGTPWASVTLKPTSGPSTVSSQTVALPSPLPEPNATPVPASPAASGPIGTAFRIPSLAPATTYAVTATATTDSSTCRPLVESSSSFTTK